MIRANPSRSAGRSDGLRRGERGAGGAGLGETAEYLVPPGEARVLEGDPAVHVDALQLHVRRAAGGPPGVGEVLLRRVRDAAAERERNGERCREPGQASHQIIRRRRAISSRRSASRSAASQVGTFSRLEMSISSAIRSRMRATLRQARSRLNPPVWAMRSVSKIVPPALAM